MGHKCSSPEAPLLQHDEDEDEDFDASPGKGSKKRKRASASPKKAASRANAKTKGNAGPKKTAAGGRKRRKTARESDEESELELEDGQEIVGVVVQAPKKGRGVCCPSCCVAARSFIRLLCYSSTWTNISEYARLLV